VEITNLNDSLRECQTEKKELDYEVKLANAATEAANKRADAVQSTAEKTRSNTTSTIVVKGAEQIKNQPQ
jgi:hypothetical protein